MEELDLGFLCCLLAVGCADLARKQSWCGIPDEIMESVVECYVRLIMCQ